ncbi:MAG: ATP-binding cassette domain-containing protein, partial [Gammaproteobacteria bacterium]|nr:ATP-binding cassette domain-containing protein [Gammaproteobacteria bacterium]
NIDKALEDAQKMNEGVKPLTQMPVHLALQDISYRYLSEKANELFTVGPLNLEFNSSELVFIVGHNGAGKTTFAKLISGLYQSEQGKILCNDIAIDKNNLNNYRQLFSVIFTDPFVFDAIKFGYENSANLPKPIKIQSLLEKLQLTHKVTVSDNSIEHNGLSHGQKKRLALLTAYMENRPIIIFDEWAENQDPEFKDVFYKKLLPELRDSGKLVIVITHESQYFSHADRVVKLGSYTD